MKTKFIAFILFISFSGFAQDAFKLDESSKGDIIVSLASIMKEKYLYADKGEEMSRHILNLYENGEYDKFSDVKLFCSKLTSDLRSIDNDKHLYVFFSPEEAYEVKAYHNLLPEEEIKTINDHMYELDRRENFGFTKVEVLPGNVGYLDLDYFTIADTSEQTLKGAMKFLSNTDAIIIDLRNNGGGEGSPLFFSYFFSEGEEIDLGGCVCRDTSLNEQSRTLKQIEGKRMPDTPLYILTNSRTFSAAEGFAFNMQSLKRGLIIGEEGERTKGGAHPVDILIVKGDILTQFPICESTNPLVETNWEKVGVCPDVDSSSEDALKVAHRRAIQDLIEKTSDLEYREELKTIRAHILFL